MDFLPSCQIALTRSDNQTLKNALQAYAIEVVECPLFSILPLSESEQKTTHQAFKNFLKEKSVIVFISPNAVRYAFAWENSLCFWQKHILLASGKTTQQALKEKGLDAFVSQTQSAEGLIQWFEKNPQSTHNVAILRGNSGREILPQFLHNRGKNVGVFALYQRQMASKNQAQTLFNLATEGKINAIVFTSSEVVRFWFSILKMRQVPQPLVKLPVFAIHPRIAKTLHDFGFLNVVNTQNSSALVDCLTHFQWNKNG